MRPAPILLDTCAALWATEADALSAQAQAAIDEADEAGVVIYISPITAWEIGLLVSRGRVALSLPPKAWFKALGESGVVTAALTPDILVESSFLPSSTLRDPGDRIIAATARELGYRLMTRDKPLLDYAAAGWLQAIPC